MSRPETTETWRRPELRATIAVVVLAIAGIIAQWPRTAPASVASAASGVGGMSTSDAPHALPAQARTAPTPDDGALAPLRARAALRPCPTAPPGGRGASAAGPLAGIVVPCLGGPGMVELAAGLAGRPALLNVWASWCRPCREEIPVLARYAAQPGAVAVIGIDVQDQPADALTLLASLGVHYPSVTDPRAELLAALHSPPVSCVPRNSDRLELRCRG